MRNDHFASCSTAQHDDFSLHLDVCSVGDADAALADEPSNADGCGFWGIKGSLSKTLLQKTPEMKWWMPSYLGGAALVVFPSILYLYASILHNLTQPLPHNDIPPLTLVYEYVCASKPVGGSTLPRTALAQPTQQSWTPRIWEESMKHHTPLHFWRVGLAHWRSLKPGMVSGRRWFLCACSLQTGMLVLDPNVSHRMLACFSIAKASNESQEWMTCYLGWVLFTANSLTLWLFQTFIVRSLAR